MLLKRLGSNWIIDIWNIKKCKIWYFFAKNGFFDFKYCHNHKCLEWEISLKKRSYHCLKARKEIWHWIDSITKLWRYKKYEKNKFRHFLLQKWDFDLPLLSKPYIFRIGKFGLRETILLSKMSEQMELWIDSDRKLWRHKNTWKPYFSYNCKC